jgi:hypothetical protein
LSAEALCEGWKLAKPEGLDKRSMVEREGFEPSRPVFPDSCLAGKRFRPLSHLSEEYFQKNIHMKE